MGPKLQRILQASLKEAALYLWRPAARIFWVSCDSRTLSVCPRERTAWPGDRSRALVWEWGLAFIAERVVGGSWEPSGGART